MAVIYQRFSLVTNSKRYKSSAGKWLSWNTMQKDVLCQCVFRGEGLLVFASVARDLQMLEEEYIVPMLILLNIFR